MEIGYALHRRLKMVKVLKEQDVENFLELFAMFKEVAEKKASYLTKSEIVELFRVWRQERKML